MLVEDTADVRIDSFKVAPIARGVIVFGSLVSAWVVAAVLSGTALMLFQIYIYIAGGELLTSHQFVRMVGSLVLCIFSGSSVTYFLAVWIRSTSGFSSLATIVGTLIGFFTGIYIPMGVLPEQVQNVTKFLPTTHGAAMMRQVYMEKAMDKVFVLAPPETEKAFQTLFGV